MSPRYDLEIIPPARGEVLAPDDTAQPWALAPSSSLDGFFSSATTRWRAGRRTRTLQTLTKTMDAARELFAAETRAIESRIRSQEAAYSLQELPGTQESEAARIRAERAEAMREVEHRNEMAELRRATERAHAEAMLATAQQTASLERERGYELASKKRTSELLDVELALAERETILRQHLAEQRQFAMTRSSAAAPEMSGSPMKEALYQARAQLLAHGLDTSVLDDLLGHRPARR
jgi:hypothetical protein